MRNSTVKAIRKQARDVMAPNVQGLNTNEQMTRARVTNLENQSELRREQISNLEGKWTTFQAGDQQTRQRLAVLEQHPCRTCLDCMELRVRSFGGRLRWLLTGR